MDRKLSFLLSLAGFFATPVFAQRPPSTQQELVPLTFSMRGTVLKPQNADAVLILANIHCRKKDYRALLTDCETYLRIWPDGPEVAKVKETHDAVKRLLGRAPASPLERPAKP